VFGFFVVSCGLFIDNNHRLLW